jgi:transcriptional regulator with XRE-family HTH domain
MLDGKGIKTMRNLGGYKQLDIAKKVHVSQQLVSMWELSKREPSEDQYKRLIRVLTRPAK